MHKIVRVLGMPPQSILSKATKCHKFFELDPSNGGWKLPQDAFSSDKDKPSSSSQSKLADSYPELPDVSEEMKSRAKNPYLAKRLGYFVGGPCARRKGESGHEPEKYLIFEDLILKLLDYDPE